MGVQASINARSPRRFQATLSIVAVRALPGHQSTLSMRLKICAFKHR
jgi:hypothetical protein